MDINISRYLDYREIIRKLAKKNKISFKSLAASAHIHTSYFSRVMADNANFSPEQLYSIGRDLNLSSWELDYFLLLGEYQSTGTPQHKSYLRNKIEGIQKKRQKVIAEMKDVETEFGREHTAIYYREAVTAKVHMYITIDKYRLRPQLICNKILISEHKLEIELQKLEELKIISREGGEIQVLKYNVHLEESDTMVPTLHINWRLETIGHINKRTPQPSDFHLSAVFSTNENTKIHIKELFQKFVVEAQKEASKVKGNEEVFHLSFDLY